MTDSVLALDSQRMRKILVAQFSGIQPLTNDQLLYTLSLHIH